MIRRDHPAHGQPARETLPGIQRQADERFLKAWLAAERSAKWRSRGEFLAVWIAATAFSAMCGAVTYAAVVWVLRG